MNFGVCDFSRLAVTDWRLCFVALMTGTPFDQAVFLPFKWKYIVIILWFFMCRNMYLELFKIHIFYQKIQNFCRKFAGKGNGRNWCLCVAVQKSGDWEEWRSMSDLNKSSSLRDFEKADHVNHLASNEEIGRGEKKGHTQSSCLHWWKREFEARSEWKREQQALYFGIAYYSGISIIRPSRDSKIWT